MGSRRACPLTSAGGGLAVRALPRARYAGRLLESEVPPRALDVALFLDWPVMIMASIFICGDHLHVGRGMVSSLCKSTINRSVS